MGVFEQCDTKGHSNDKRNKHKDDRPVRNIYGRLNDPRKINLTKERINYR